MTFTGHKNSEHLEFNFKDISMDLGYLQAFNFRKMGLLGHPTKYFWRITLEFLLR